MKIHKFPKKWFEQGQKMSKEIAEMINADVRVNAYVAYKGGWKAGYRTKGNVSVYISWPNSTSKWNQYSTPIKYFGKYDLVKIKKWWMKNHAENRAKEYVRVFILELYRDSGLIPKRVAKRHNSKMLERFGKGYLKTRAGQVGLMTSCNRYLKRFAKCPKCGKRGGFAEEIQGITCPYCESYWDNGKWDRFNGVIGGQ